MRKRSTVQGLFCEINPETRQIGKNFNFCPDSLAPSRELSHYPTSRRPFSPPFSPCFWKTFLIKNPAWDLDLSVASAGGRQHQLQGPLFIPRPSSSHDFFLCSARRRWHPRRLSILSATHSSRKREKEKPAAALPMGKRRGSRFKSRIFRGRKAARLLKANKKKKRAARDPFQACSFFHFVEK